MKAFISKFESFTVVKYTKLALSVLCAIILGFLIALTCVYGITLLSGITIVLDIVVFVCTMLGFIEDMHYED